MASIAVISLPQFVTETRRAKSVPVLDPAQKVLLLTEEAKKRRKQEETQLQLDKIHDRIEYTLKEYEAHPDAASIEGEMNFELLEDPVQLYDLLSDTRLRAKYQQHLTVFIVDFEEKCENREKVLQSLQDFFTETQAGNTQQVLAEISADEVNLDEATVGLNSAMETAQNAASKLLKIKQEMGQLFAIFSMYPDTKKGRKKIEKALLKAQEEVETLSTTLQTVHRDLEQSKQKCSQLQKQIEAKSAECTKLKQTGDHLKKLQMTNDSLKAELANIHSALMKAQEDLASAKSVPPETIVKESVKVDEGKIHELEAQLVREKEDHQKLVAERTEMEAEFQSTLKALQMEHDAEVQEMRGRFEEQLKSLMIDEEEEDPTDTSMREDDHVSLVSEAESQAMIEEQEGSSLVAGGDVNADGKVKKLQAELAAMKNKFQKSVTGLRAQLADAQNKHMTELTVQQKEVSNLKEIVQQLQRTIATLEEQIDGLQEGKQSAEAELEHRIAGQQEQQVIIEQLQQELAEARSPPVTRVVNRSAQWSEISRQTTPTPTPPKVPGATPPMIPMDEVLHDSMSSLSLQQTPCYGSAIQMTSMQGSLVSLDMEPAPCGSPLRSGGSAVSEFQRHPLLAQSRLSHQSASPQSFLSFNHPVVVEWTRVYDMVMRFRASLVDTLSENKHLASYAGDLEALEVHSMDKTQDVQGQITQMRFSLALLLHQIEQTVQECLGVSDIGMEDRGTTKESKTEPGVLRDTIAHLHRQLKQSEEIHNIELQESKETIANLSSKVDSLKIEMANLRRNVRVQDDAEGIIMFTRLDSERNTKALKTALAADRISPTTFTKLTSSMQEYLSIPGKRLAFMTKRSHDRTITRRLIEHVQEAYPNPAKLVDDISCLDERRQLEFTSKMDHLRVRRLDLARTLTHTLTHVENTARVFLIKPVYAPRGRKGGHGLITPIARSIPTHKPPPTRSGRSTPHPNMRLVSALLSSRQSHHDEHTAMGFTNISGRATPHVKGIQAVDSGEWMVDASRPSGGSPVMCPPSMPKLVELEVLKGRQAASLLGHLLPGRHPLKAERHQLAPLEEVGSSSAGTLEASVSPLPPIQVPSSRTDEPIAAVV